MDTKNSLMTREDIIMAGRSNMRNLDEIVKLRDRYELRLVNLMLFYAYYGLYTPNGNRYLKQIKTIKTKVAILNWVLGQKYQISSLTGCPIFDEMEDF